MAWLYAATICLGSCLLFLVQPMVGRMVLPLMGGTPAVWTTCMMFFQTGLLLGYASAHMLPRLLGVRRHAVLHLGLLLAAYFTLPIELPGEVADGWHPVAWLLLSLTRSVGLPFVLLAAGAPLIQHWYALREQSAPRDPYVLYAASNVGSLLALALFPFVFEPIWSLRQQGKIWSGGFLLLTVLLAGCMPRRPAIVKAPTAPSGDAPSWSARGKWIVLSLIPSSLLLSVTAHLTTDLASIPLLWLIPMGVYLTTYMLVFGRRDLVPRRFLERYLPLLAIVLALLVSSEATEPLPLVLGLHLLGLTWISLVCHVQLADSRPPAERLTDFYLCLAVGGLLGGVLNALVAPVVFPGQYEYPAMIVLACLVALPGGLRPTRNDWLWAAGIGGASAALILTGPPLSQRLPEEVSPTLVIVGVALLACYLTHQRHARFALGLAAVLLSGGVAHGVHGATELRARSYFGMYRVTRVGGLRRLVHGSTVHGQQSVEPDRRHLPLTYYSREGPLGDLFRVLRGDSRFRDVGAVGLGTGSAAAYSQPGECWTFFEIDPAVARIARDPRFFTYLADANGDVDIVLGDARLQLNRSQSKFDVLILDAFSSDSIPVHLLTREALAVYFDRLKPDGVLVFHISNRHIDLEQVLANLAADRTPPCVAYVREYLPTPKETETGVMQSTWLAIARSDEDLQPLTQLREWRRARARPGLAAWTDDRSNLLQAFRWRDAE